MTGKPHLEHRDEDSFDGWLTPQWVLDLVRKMGPIDLDPCTEAGNPVGAARFFTEGGLDKSWWACDGSVWVNSPYGRALAAWANKAVAESGWRHDMFVLTPARTETGWFGHLFDHADALALFRKRIHFSHPSQPGANSPKFPNAMFYFGPNPAEFKCIFEYVARVVIL